MRAALHQCDFKPDRDLWYRVLDLSALTCDVRDYLPMNRFAAWQVLSAIDECNGANVVIRTAVMQQFTHSTAHKSKFVPNFVDMFRRTLRAPSADDDQSLAAVGREMLDSFAMWRARAPPAADVSTVEQQPFALERCVAGVTHRFSVPLHTSDAANIVQPTVPLALSVARGAEKVWFSSATTIFTLIFPYFSGHCFYGSCNCIRSKRGA